MAAIQNEKDRKREEIQQLEKLNQDGLEKLQLLKEQMAAIQKDMVAANRDDTQAEKIMAAWGAYENGLERMRQEEYTAAVESFTKVIEVHPGPDNYLWRAKAYRKAGDAKRALDDLDLVVKLDPRVAEAYFMRGQILRAGGEKKEGLNEIRKAASMGHGKAKLWLKAKGR